MPCSATAFDGIPVAVRDVAPSTGDAADETPPERLSTDLQPSAFATAGALPECPGPFGGTTVLVLPDATPPTVFDGWNQLAEDDPLAKASRFHRLRLASTDGANRLEDVLVKLRDENRKTILIVPATFCADDSRMQALQKIVAPFENEMTIHWLPGLGGQTMAFKYGVESIESGQK